MCVLWDLKGYFSICLGIEKESIDIQDYVRNCKNMRKKRIKKGSLKPPFFILQIVTIYGIFLGTTRRHPPASDS